MSNKGREFILARELD